MNLKSLLFLLLIITIPTATATTIESYSWGDKIIYNDGTFEINQHGNNYQTWEGVWESKDLMEVGTTHYPYLIIDGGTQWTLTKNGEFLTLPKNLVYSYSFNPYHIGMTITTTPTQLNSISTYHNVAGNDTWYIIIPDQLVNNVKVFNWDNKSPIVSNQNGTQLNQSNFKYHKVGDEIRFYYNQEERDFGIASTEIIFEFNSWYVVGDGGSAWSGNVTFSKFDWDNKLFENVNGYIQLNYENKLQNSGFETINSSPFNVAEYWSNSTWLADDYNYFTRNTSVSNIPEGTYVIKGDDSTTTSRNVYSDSFIIYNETTYKLSVYQHTEGAWSRTYLTTWDDISTTVSVQTANTISASSSAWAEKTTTLTINDDLGGDNIGRMRVRLYRYNTVGAAFWDKIKVNCTDLYLSGNLTQNVHDSGAGYEIQKTGINGTFADGTVSVDLQINSSADNSSWTGWYTVQSNVTTGTMYDVPAGYQKRYYQVRCVLSTTNASQTPIITNIRSLIGAAAGEYIPPTPTDLQNTTGNFWIYHNWTVGSGNVTDSYNVSINSTWYNTTTNLYYNNTGLSPHGFSEVIVYSYNTTGNGSLSTNYITDNVTIPNNLITISNISASYTINEGDTLYIDAEATDADSDTPTFADNSTTWNVNTSTGITTWQTVDGDDGTYHWYINVSDGYGSIDTQAFNVTVNNSIYPPTVELLSQTPSVLYQNSTGTFNLTWGITHSTAGLNNTSISFVNTMWDIVNDHYNLSIRPPNNDKAAYSVYFDEYILRGNNRNETLNFENNATITEGNIWKWSGLDENNTELTIEVINSTYTKVHINTLVHDHVFSNMCYLDRSTMQEAPKTQYSIYKDHGALIKFWDAEAAVGHVHLGCAHLDTGLGAVEPTPANPIEVWYVNKSYNPSGGVAVENSPYAFYMTSLTKDDWVNYTYTPHANSSYARCITINSTDIENAGVNVTDIAYLYLTSQTNNNRPFYLNMTNVSSGTNVSFADTNVMWSGTAPFTQVNYTPNMFITMIHDNYQYQAKLYTADNDDLWGNSTLHTSNVEVSIFPPTKPSIHHILYNGVEYQNSAIDNQTFNGIVDVAVGVSTDPDGGAVTHNLTLHYRNESLVAIINNTFTEPKDTFAEIEFNTTTYYSYIDEYTLRVIATDDDGDNQTTWLGYNFTLYATGAPTNLQNTTGNHWVNFTWDSGANTDAYNVTFNGTWYNSTNVSINHSVGAHGWGNITVWAWNDSSGMSAGSISDNVQVPNNAPVLTGIPDSNTNEDVPINDAFDLDTYYSDVDGDSPSYSVYSNNQTGNVTPSIDGNNVVSYALAANWYGVAEIVYKVEDGYGANDTDTVLVIVSSVNDPPILQPIGAQNVNEGQTVTIEVAGTDVETPEVDLDFTCNRTDLFTDFSINGGWTEWVTNYSQAGIYHVLFTVTDGTDSDNETVVITVTDIPLAIDSYWNNQTGSSLFLSVDTGTTVAFGVTTNRTANTTWYNHSIFAETDTDTTQANYTSTFSSVGTFYINASATDGIDQTANTTFTVEVSVPSVYYNVSGYVFDTNATAISGATVSNNQTAGTNVTNVSGYYVLSLENGSVLITATASGYVSNTTVATVSGDTPNQNITLVSSPAVEEQDNTMPLPLFITWTLILFVLMFTAYPKRDEYEDFDIGVKNVTASFISIILSFTLSKVVINGQLVQVFSGISSTDVVITGTTVIQISWLGWLFSFIGISMVLLLVMCLVSLYKDIYGDVTDE